MTITTAIINKSRGGTTHWYECGYCRTPLNPFETTCQNCGAKIVWGDEKNGGDKVGVSADRIKQMLEEICGTCRHHVNVDGEWVCLEKGSDAYGLETGYRDGDDCEYWKGRER